MLNSQEVVNVVRLQIAQKKELDKICEFICDLCLAPDTATGAGTGCDNMTILIIALLNGRTPSEWYDWVADRFERGYGFQTPKQVPEVYPASRIAAARERRQAHEERMERERNENANNNAPWRSNSAFGIARSMLGGGGIFFHPGPGVLSDDGALVITTTDDSDEDESGEEDHDDGEGDVYTFGNPEEDARDVMRSLKAQLDELAEQDEEHGISTKDQNHNHLDMDVDSPMSDPEEETEQEFAAIPYNHVKANSNAKNVPAPVSESPAPLARSRAAKEETTPVLHKLPNGDSAHLAQLKSNPGDAVAPAVKAEGLIDRSEDPVKAMP